MVFVVSSLFFILYCLTHCALFSITVDVPTDQPPFLQRQAFWHQNFSEAVPNQYDFYY